METYKMNKNLKYIISEENYGDTTWNENKRYKDLLGLPNSLTYQNQERFKTDLKYRINDFLEEIGYSEGFTDDVQFYTIPDELTNSNMDKEGICINQTHY